MPTPKPIEVFKNEEQLNACLKEWQERLFLNDWTITVRFKPYDDEIGKHGLCESLFENKCAWITIYDKIEIKECMQKLCDEKVLIHELLHCKFLHIENGSYEGKVLYEYQHQLLEEMAKSLLMAKYKLKFSWFNPDNDKKGSVTDEKR